MFLVGILILAAITIFLVLLIENKGDAKDLEEYYISQNKKRPSHKEK